jgi:hypothetical protein
VRESRSMYMGSALSLTMSGLASVGESHRLCLPKATASAVCDGATGGGRAQLLQHYAFVRPERLKKNWDRDRIVTETVGRGVPCSAVL